MSGVPASEFSRMIDLRQIGDAPVELAANEAERAALAARFDLVRIDRLEARVTLEAKGAEVDAMGRMQASWVQSCAISGEDLPQQADEEIAFRFVPERASTQSSDTEIELTSEDCDEIPYSGSAFDLGEAVAQSLVLAIDPFAEGPEAERARAAAGIVSEGKAGPFAALAGLKLPKGS